MAELEEKQKRFCEEYLIDLNATQAYIRAGYSARSAKTLGPKLLSKVGVRAYVDKQIAIQSRRTGVNADRVVRELARIAFASVPDAVNMLDASMRENASAADKAAIQSIRVKVLPSNGDGEPGIEREIKFHDKIKALDLLGRHTGATIDREALKLARERLELERQKASQGTPDAKDTGVVLIPAVPDDPDTETT